MHFPDTYRSDLVEFSVVGDQDWCERLLWSSFERVFGTCRQLLWENGGHRSSNRIHVITRQVWRSFSGVSNPDPDCRLYYLKNGGPKGTKIEGKKFVTKKIKQFTFNDEKFNVNIHMEAPDFLVKKYSGSNPPIVVKFLSKSESESDFSIPLHV